MFLSTHFEAFGSPTKAHSIVEYLELEGTSEDHVVQLPCDEQGHHSCCALGWAVAVVHTGVTGHVSAC